MFYYIQVFCNLLLLLLRLHWNIFLFFHFSYKSPRAGSLLGKQDPKQRRRRQRELQKSNGVLSKTTTLHVSHTFCTFFLPSLPSLHDFLNFSAVSKRSTPRKLAVHLTLETFIIMVFALTENHKRQFQVGRLKFVAATRLVTDIP